MPIDSRMLPPHIQKQILRKIAEQDAAKKNPPDVGAWCVDCRAEDRGIGDTGL